MSHLKSEVLACFRRLHRTRLVVFRDDQYALQETRRRINEEFRKNMTETDPSKIKEYLKLGNEVEHILRAHVKQASLKSDGIYELKLNKDNLPYKNSS